MLDDIHVIIYTNQGIVIVIMIDIGNEIDMFFDDFHIINYTD